MSDEETVRFPTRLDPAAIYERMASIRQGVKSIAAGAAGETK